MAGGEAAASEPQEVRGAGGRPAAQPSRRWRQAWGGVPRAPAASPPGWQHTQHPSGPDRARPGRQPRSPQRSPPARHPLAPAGRRGPFRAVSARCRWAVSVVRAYGRRGEVGNGVEGLCASVWLDRVPPNSSNLRCHPPSGCPRPKRTCACRRSGASQGPFCCASLAHKCTIV